MSFSEGRVGGEEEGPEEEGLSLDRKRVGGGGERGLGEDKGEEGGWWAEGEEGGERELLLEVEVRRQRIEFQLRKRQ